MRQARLISLARRVIVWLFAGGLLAGCSARPLSTPSPEPRPVRAPVAHVTAPPTAVPTATPRPTPWVGPLPAGTIALYAAGAWDYGSLYAVTADGRSLDLGRTVIGAAPTSPSGRWIVTLNDRGRPQSVIIRDLESGGRHVAPLTIGRGTGYVAWGAFNREETQFVFVEVEAIEATPMPGPRHWFLVAVVDLRDGSTRRFEVVGEENICDVLPGHPLGWSPAGELVLDTFRPYSDAFAAGIWALVPTAESDPASIGTMERRLLLSDTRYMQPRLSPDGARLLYLVRDPDYTPADYRPPDFDLAMNALYSLEVASGEATRLVEVRDGGALAGVAAWSPDGREMLFAQGRYAPGAPGDEPLLSPATLKACSAGGAAREIGPLPAAGILASLDWCTPGTALAAFFIPNSMGQYELYTIDLASGHATLVARAPDIRVLGCVRTDAQLVGRLATE